MMQLNMEISDGNGLGSHAPPILDIGSWLMGPIRNELTST